MTRVGVIVPAAGTGLRLGGVPKAQLELAGVPMLQRALEPFLVRPDLQAIVVVLPAAMVDDPPSWLRRDTIRLVPGGAQRSDSVRAGLHALPDVDIVVVHDAARPLASADLIERVIQKARTGVGAIAALPATDTLHVVDADGRIVQTPQRSTLWHAQTPQAFPRALLQQAHERALAAGVTATDDAALVVRYGGNVQVVPGEHDNLKVTVPADLERAAALLARRP